MLTPHSSVITNIINGYSEINCKFAAARRQHTMKSEGATGFEILVNGNYQETGELGSVVGRIRFEHQAHCCIIMSSFTLSLAVESID